MPVSSKRYSLVGIITSDGPFIQHAGLVSQTSSQPVHGSGQVQVAQPTRLVRKSTSQKPATSIAVDTHQHSITGSSEMPVLQPARPAGKVTVTQ